MFFFKMTSSPSISFFFFFNDTATTEIYTLSLHDALPICVGQLIVVPERAQISRSTPVFLVLVGIPLVAYRSEEHTSELQSRSDLVCRLLLEKKKKTQQKRNHRRIST